MNPFVQASLHLLPTLSPIPPAESRLNQGVSIACRPHVQGVQSKACISMNLFQSLDFLLQACCG